MWHPSANAPWRSPVHGVVPRFLRENAVWIVKSDTDIDCMPGSLEARISGKQNGDHQMVQIVASEEFARQLEKTEGIVELVDTNGNRLGTLTRPPSAEDIRVANERRAADKPGLTTDQLVERIQASGSE